VEVGEGMDSELTDLYMKGILVGVIPRNKLTLEEAVLIRPR
jgi:hypothetical protein